MKIDLREYSVQELSLHVMNDEELFSYAKNGRQLFKVIDARYLVNIFQVSHLIKTLTDNYNEQLRYDWKFLHGTVIGS